MHSSLKGVIRSGWFRSSGTHGANRAKQIEVGVTGRRPGRTALIGIIGDGGLCHFEFHKAGNTENVEGLLLRAHRKLGNLLVYTDNASYHGQNMFDRLYEATDGGIIVGYLPGYTPQLAPIEIQWREIKRYIANLFFDDIDQMEDAVIDGLRRGLTKIVKVYDYMIV